MGKILITGGAGFIGSSLADELIHDNDIVVLDNLNDYYSPKIKLANISTIMDNKKYTFYHGDILDERLLEKIFANNEVKTVIHLAARAGVRPSIEQPKLYHKVNVDGTKNLLEACKKNNVQKVLFASSSSVYGALLKGPFSEDMNTSKTISPYAETKVKGEIICKEYSDCMQITILRFFTVYGPRQRPDLAINKFVNFMSCSKPIPVYGNGKTKRNYTYITDILEGIKKAMVRQGSSYEIINIGGDRTIELNELIALIEKLLGKSASINRLPIQKGDVPLTHADISKARELLGYEPKVSIEKGLSMYINWFERNRNGQKT